MQYLSFLWLAYFLWLDILRDHECCSIWQNFLYMANVPFYVYITSDGRLDASSFCCCCCEVASVMFDSLRPHRQQPTRLPRPWDSPGKNTGVGCHFLLQCMKVKIESEVARLCPTPSDPMDCSLPGSSVYGILHARTLEWVAISFSNAWK